MGGSKLIERAIEDICDYIADAKPKGFSGTQVIVDKERLIDMLDELKRKLPEEVERCQKIMEKRDQIIKEAELRAKTMLEEADRRAQQMVRENEISRQAYLQANEYYAQADAQASELMENASMQAEQIRAGAFDYTKNLLLQVEELMTAALESTRAKYDDLVQVLSANIETVVGNRKELCEEIAPEMPEVQEITGEEEFNSDEINFLGADEASDDNY